MENFTVLFGAILKWILLFFSIIGLIIFIIQTKNKKTISMIFTLIISLLLFLSFLYLYTKDYKENQKMLNKIAGIYKIKKYECKICNDCFIDIKDNKTYSLIRSKQIILSGKWDYEIDFDKVSIKIDRVSDYMEIDSSKTLPYAKDDFCR